MIAEYSFSKARSGFTELIDRVQRLAPAVIKPRKKTEEPSIVLSRSFLLELLREDRGTQKVKPLFIEEPDKSVTLVLDELGIAVNAETRGAAIEAATKEAVEYAQEYLSPENVALYVRSPNRGRHLPVVVRIALCNSMSEVMETLGLA